MGDFSDHEKKLIQQAFETFAKTLESHRTSLARLQENQEAEFAKMVELAKMVRQHEAHLQALQAAMTNSFKAQADLIESLRGLMPPEPSVDPQVH
jgi:type I site-specific restriction endonuclease